MTMAPRERLAAHHRLAEALGPAMVNRGVLQHFFISPALPVRRLGLAEIGAAWRRHAANVRARRVPELIHLYLHIPFCSHRCRYCVYYSVGNFEPSLLETYLRRLHTELDYYADLFGGTGITTCYIGGGTPTVLSVNQIDELLSHLDRAFARKRGGEWAFECNPLTMTEGKARIFRDHGFNRVSFGVQTLNPNVLDGVNRGYQSYLRVAETFRVMQDLNFWINVDLIHGLPGEATASMDRSLDQILGFEPEQVTIYAISPYTPIAAIDTARLPPIRDSLERLEPIARRHGYRSGAGTTCLHFTSKKKRPDNLLMIERRHLGFHHSYDDTTVEPFSLLGLGPTARCYIYGQMRYMLDRYPVDEPFDAQVPCATGRPVTMDEERRRYVVYQLEKPGGLRASEYARLFAQPLGAAFGSELDAVLKLGLLEYRRGALVHTAQDTLQRFATELFFVHPAMQAEVLRQLHAPERDAESLAEQPEPPASSEASESQEPAELRDGPTVRIEAAGVTVHAILADYWADRPCYHHAGSFAFFVPSDLPEGTCNLGDRKERLLRAFSLLFDRVIDRDAPPDRAALMRSLEEEAGRRPGLTISWAADTP